jgi:uncharacterized protein YuzE
VREAVGRPNELLYSAATGRHAALKQRGKPAAIYERRSSGAFTATPVYSGKPGNVAQRAGMDGHRYDPEADALVVKLGEGAVADEELLDNDAAVGYDREGRVVYVEVLDASKKGLASALAELAKARAVERPPPRK